MKRADNWEYTTPDDWPAESQGAIVCSTCRMTREPMTGQRNDGNTQVEQVVDFYGKLGSVAP